MQLNSLWCMLFSRSSSLHSSVFIVSQSVASLPGFHASASPVLPRCVRAGIVTSAARDKIPHVSHVTHVTLETIVALVPHVTLGMFVIV